MFHACVVHAIFLVCISNTTPVTTSGTAETLPAPSVATPSSGVTIDTDPARAASPTNNAEQRVPVETTIEVKPKHSPVLKRATASAVMAPSADRPWYRNGLVGLAAVLGLILLVSYLLRRYVPAVRALGGGALKVVQRTPLSSKQSIVLVQVGRRMVLIGVTPDRINSLSVIDDPEEFAYLQARVGKDAQTPGQDFDNVLSAEADKFDREPLEAVISRSDNSKRLCDTKGHLEGMLKKLKGMQAKQK